MNWIKGEGQARIFVGVTDDVLLCMTPKCASSSIGYRLREYWNHWPKKRSCHDPILPFYTIDERQRMKPYARIAQVVRNPFDRLVSNYRFHIQQTKLAKCANMRRLGFKASMGWFEFFDKVMSEPCADPHFAPFWVMEPWPQYTLRLETMHDDWIGFQEWAGVRLGDLRHDNVTQGSADWRQYYTPLMRQRVERLYARDLEAHGYGFD